MGKAKKNKNQKPKKTDSAFQKRKVKVGKKLIKSSETNISIKTRKIQLPTQHSKKGDQHIFKGKCIKEYLIGTKHTNSNQRTQNITNIHDMVCGNADLVKAHIGSLLERLGVLLQDSEDGVRQAAIVLTKTVMVSVRSEDLTPFLHVFITQLSSGMLHINKSVQKSIVYALQCLLQNHFHAAMKLSDPFLSSLVTLLSTTNNKACVLEYFHALASILKFYKKPVSSTMQCKVQSSSVALYKYTTQSKSEEKPTDNVDMLKKLCSSSLSHLANIWLEEAPSQVYAHADPGVLRTCTHLVELLNLIRHCPNVVHSNPTLMKLNDITKSVYGRFPLVCSSINKDQKLLWSLNLKIAQYLVSVERYLKVTEYFMHCFKQRLQELSSDEVSEALSLLSNIPDLPVDTIRQLQHYTDSQSSSTGRKHSVPFLSHIVRNGWLHSVDQDQLLRSLENHLPDLASDIVYTFYQDRTKVTPAIFSLCLDRKIFSTLSADDQVKCLELLFCDNECAAARTLSGLGQVISSTVVRNKFYSILQSLYHEERLGEGDYISILLSQANRDEDETETVSTFCSTLLHNFSPLPLAVKQSLFWVCAPRITDQLYAGLSDFSLAAYLTLLRGFHTMACPDHVGIQDEVGVKLCKIVCSLVFNTDSLTDWGSDIVKLAVKLSIEQPYIFDYVVTKMNLENKPCEILLWYLKVALKSCRKDEVFRKGVSVLWKFLESRVSENEIKEVRYRLKLVGFDR